VKPAPTLLRHDLSALRRSTIWWTVGIVSLSLVNVAFWPSLEGSEAMEAFDDMGALLEAFGAQDLASPAGYLDGQMFALMLPALLAGMALASLSGKTAGDEGAGKLEVLLALPVRRSSVWLARWVASMISLAVVATAAGGLVVVTRPVFSLDEVGVGALLGATAGCAVLAAFTSSIAYAAAGAGASRGKAAGLAVAVIVTSYVMAYLAPLSERLEWVRSWSPWHWALGEQPVSDGAAIGPLFGVLVLIAALVGGGTLAVERRDIHNP